MLSDRDTFEVDGLTFRVTIEPDDYQEAPWTREDGHGVVNGWEHRDKRAGERVLIEDRGSKLLYDVPATLVIAKRDGWGLGPDHRDALVKRLGREPSRKEIVAQAVALDFERLEGWCRGSWNYVYLVVTLLDVDGAATPESESLGGIESDATDYIEETAKELASEIVRRVGDRVELTESRTWTIREEGSESVILPHSDLSNMPKGPS